MSKGLVEMKTIKTTLSALAVAGSLVATSAFAAGGGGHTKDHDFSFEGPLGVYDRGELQRGLQIYIDVCSDCHGMKYVSFRTLGDKNGPGIEKDQIKAIIAEKDYQVQDEGKEPGETRLAKSYDYFPEVYGDGMGPDMSLLAKARAGGPAHIYSILTGYEEAPACTPEDYDAGYYNTAFGSGGIPDECKDEHGHSTVEGTWIAMAPPLADGDIEYADGTENSLDQMSNDISAFLMWAAEPHLVERKQAGLRNIIFLLIFAALLWFTNKKIWKKIKHPE